MQNNVDFGSKPKFVICFVCGREFSKGSLEIHFYQCAKKAETEDNKTIEIPAEYLEFFEKVKNNEKISFAQIEDFNEFSNKLYKSKNLYPCMNCGRRFLKDRLEVHLRGCKPDPKKSPGINSLTEQRSNSKLLNNNIIKNINNARSVEKINPSKLNINSNQYASNLNINSIQATNNPNSLVSKNIKIKDAENLNLGNNKISKSFKESACPNCGEKIELNKIGLHIKKCTGNKRTTSVQRIGSSANKFNPRNSYSGNLKNNNLENFNSNTKSSSNFNFKKNKDDMGKTSQNFKSEKDSNFNKTPFAGEKAKPSFLVCYICGREFGKTSLEIHLKSCKIKFLNAEEISSSADKSKRNSNSNSSLPEPPEILYSIIDKINSDQKISQAELSEYNELAYQIYNKKSLKPCPGCKRTFLKESLEVHLRSCKLGQKAAENETVMKITSRPRMLICPLCGREFGTMSLEIHIKTCRKKFDIEQEQLPANLRRSADAILEKYYKNKELNEKNDNQAIGGSSQKGTYNFDQINDETYQIFTKEALVPCENCGRTFLPDRLIVHLRSCKIKKEKK